jgi:hypothetical protein
MRWLVSTAAVRIAAAISTRSIATSSSTRELPDRSGWFMWQSLPTAAAIWHLETQTARAIARAV